jgi:uncharacterized damage-inducible protein DinB
MDGDLENLDREQLIAEIKRLRAGIREHRDSSGQELCWHHPQLWGLLPERTDPLPTVPEWPQFLRGCVKYRESLDRELPEARRVTDEAPDDPSPSIAIAPDDLLQHWQGHRRVTRRVLEAFPEKELFEFSIGGMRPCSALALEMISMADAGIRGLATREWTMVANLAHHSERPTPQTRAEMLRLWDDVTARIDSMWPEIPQRRFEEIDKAFGEYEGPVFGLFLYWIDNEIHHRGQAYVYLRALGIEPPPFYDRS